LEKLKEVFKLSVYVAADCDGGVDVANVWFLRKDFFDLRRRSLNRGESDWRYFFAKVENFGFSQLFTLKKLFNVLIKIVVICYGGGIFHD